MNTITHQENLKHTNMKKYIIHLMVLLTCIGSFAQRDNTVNLTMITSPAAFDDGFNIGAQFEYQMPTIYTGVEVFSFPDLHEIPYTHFIARVGAHTHLDVFHDWRIYAGVRGGYIFRDGRVHPLLGVETGIDYRIKNSNIYLGLSAAYDMKADSKIWSNDDYHYVASGWFKIGYKFL